MQTIRKHPMTVYGDGKQTRSFQYVSDLVRNNLIFSTICSMIDFLKQWKMIYCLDI